MRTVGTVESLDMATLMSCYAGQEFSPTDVVETIFERIAAHADNPIWIHLLDQEAVRTRASALEGESPADLPLYGIPFAIKDNIDFAGSPTTAACPDFAYVPAETAAAVQTLLDAGAILIGKTNLDQFATGLVGTRSPYGACRNAFDGTYISGGSSSGSAVSVALGLVSFSLGTDTAGSGRVPAGFNNLVGLKPSRGLLSARGMVPACRSLDCVSIFALTVADAMRVYSVAAVFDLGDPFARPDSGAPAVPGEFSNLRLGVPKAADLEFFGDGEAAELFQSALQKIRDAGSTIAEIDYAPFRETANLLYQGPWVAERYIAVREMLERHPDALHPVTRGIIEQGDGFGAVDAFEAYYRLKELRRQTAPVWDDIDALVTPTAGTIYTIDAVEAAPVQLNTNLGQYTNYMNLLDLCGITVPAAFYRNGLPFGITLAAPAFRDRELAAIADPIQRLFGPPLGATGVAMPAAPAAPAARLDDAGDRIEVAAIGAHMSGLPLNHELTDRGATLVRKGRTAPLYQLYALGGFSPPRPGLMRAEPGHAIEYEVWSVPADQFGSFVDGIPAPLGIGTLTLEDGSEVNGFICEAYATENAEDISALGSWRAYVAR